MTKTFATAGRIAKQLSHDPHTLALALFVPSLLMTILRYVFDSQPQTFQASASSLLSIFPFLIMFIIACISMLRERKAGTLERLMTLPIARLQILGGYLITFGLLAILQALIVGVITIKFLNLSVASGSEIQVVAIAMIAGVLGTGFGLFTSSLARSEFQAVQFIPVFIFPQILVCGLFTPKDQMALPLQWLANITPPSYLVDAMHKAIEGSGWPLYQLAFLTVFLMMSLFLGAVSIKFSK